VKAFARALSSENVPEVDCEALVSVSVNLILSFKYVLEEVLEANSN